MNEIKVSVWYNTHRQMRQLNEIAQARKELVANIGIRSVKHSDKPYLEKLLIMGLNGRILKVQ